MKYINACILLCLLVSSCRNSQSDPEQLTALYGDYLQAVIEIPAGTNQKIEYDYATGSFQMDQIDGKDRVIDFLPYPGNYGFVPGTLMDTERGGDGDALDILVIGEAVETGTSMPVIPLGALLLRDRDEIDTKLIGIPADPAQQVIEAKDFMSFALRYDAARRIIEDWFQNYKGAGRVEIIRWEDEQYAWSEVEKWKK
ncbi:MAG: inorganic diphosphatase [Bacteroidota bacterium]